MGLDMFLDRYTPMELDHKNRTRYMKTRVMYWRNANMVHEWFDNNLPGKYGEIENCKDYELDTSTLVALLDDCKMVLNDHSVADNVMPTSGFFSGSTEYNERYFNDVAETAKAIEEILEEFDENDGGWYTYHAWW